MRILGGLVAEYVFEEMLYHFWRGPGQRKCWFRMGGEAKITISPKLEFYYFLVLFLGHFGAKISLKWRLASPCATLGSHLDGLFGGPKSDPGKIQKKVMRGQGFHAGAGLWLPLRTLED